MQNYFLIILLAFVSVYANAQEKDEPEEKTRKTNHELSVNSTFFVKQFLNFSNNNIEVSPYLLYYKLITKKNNAFRFGIGLDYSREDDPIVDSDDNNTSNSIDLNYRIGWEKRFDLGKKWLAFVGVDAINSLLRNKSKTVTIINNPQPGMENKIVTYLNDQTFGIGVGPVLGIQLKLSEKVALFTETSFVFMQEYIKSEVRRENAPPGLSDDTNDKMYRTSLNFIIPTSLFLAINF